MTHKGTVNCHILFCFKANKAFCTHQNFGAADSLHTYLSQSIRPTVQDDDNHPYEFKIAYFGRTGKMLRRPSSVSGMTLNHLVLPVPKFLSAPVAKHPWAEPWSTESAASSSCQRLKILTVQSIASRALSTSDHCLGTRERYLPYWVCSQENAVLEELYLCAASGPC